MVSQKIELSVMVKEWITNQTLYNTLNTSLSIMAPTTRSMARNMMEKNTVLIKDVMTTPGIATMIASNMHKDDRGLTSMYKLYNDDRYREEMDPFVFEKRIKKEMMEEIKTGLENCEKVIGSSYKMAVAMALFEYLEEMEPYLYLLGKKLARIIDFKINEFLSNHDYHDYHDYREYVNMRVFEKFQSLMMRCKNETLFDYLIWGSVEDEQ